MKTFEIYEHGCKFATIEADNATSALRKAAKEYPRRAVDYNVEPGDAVSLVEWRAFEIGSLEMRATAKITVPGRGLTGCEF